MINADCPHCGSRNTKALPVIYQDGTRDSRSQRNGVFYYRRSLGLHTSTTRGRSQTLSAKLAEPPHSGNDFFRGAAVPVLLIIGGLMGGETGFFGALVLLVILAVIVGIGSRHDPKSEQWESTFRCGRCGTVFAVIKEAPVPPATPTKG